MSVQLCPQPEAISRLDQLAERGVVDRDASVIASGSIDIEASTQRVWALLADVTNWPSIRSDVGEVFFDDIPRRGAVFTWSTGGVPLQSRFAIVEPGNRLTWTTVATGLGAVHVYRFETIETGRTRILAEESMDAPAAPQLNSAILAVQIRTWLEGIKALAEQGA
ncbi:putative membrane protein [Devosia sp. UYZn731]|uniref:SRPBCC family protein n=1 Tax=Devosia sp. UYZn731 TaxID=3156345 RepID=UPI0033978234